MSGHISNLAERKLIVVTGKGGSGKSLLSAALAHRLALQGKKVELVEIGRRRDRAFSRMPEILGVKSLEHRPREVSLEGVKIMASILDPAQSLSEYVDLKLPTAGLAGILLNNRVTASFLEVVPGLPDLVTLGRLWYSLAKATDGPDHIILDAPATGHAMALLRAPENFRRITRAGPIFRDANLMVEFLSDKTKTAIVLTSLPEEMSLQETLDAKEQLKTFPDPFVFVNKCFPHLPDLEHEKAGIHWRAYQYSKARGDREQESIKNFRQKNELIPFFFPDPESIPLYARISECLI